FDFSELKNIIKIPANAFSGCTSLKNLKLTNNINSIGDYAFFNCRKITSVEIERGSWQSIGIYAFAGCTALSELISNGNFSVGDFAFLDCPNLLDVTLEGLNFYNYISNGGRQFGYITSEDEEGNTVYELNEDMKIHARINSNTQSYAVNNGICYIPTGGVEYTLCDDYAVIDKWTEDVGNITIPAQIEGLPVTVINDNSFKNLKGIVNITLPGTLKEIGSCAFMNSALRKIGIPASVEKIGNNAFYNTEYGNSLKSEFVVLGNGVLYDYNGSSDEITVPDSVKRIGEDAFAGHSEITSVTFTSDITNIDGGAFYKCSSLTKVELPDTVKNIDVGAFTGCSSLRTVIFGKDIELIHEYAFHECNELAAFYGYAETYTEIFADKHGIYFEVLPENPAETEEETI
ncbi:MAG: leucine-rich repeat domain-containing protein, partial [Ruminococcus sp.]|nr:leucine-rich repeat domain-containing protein [Ruminococcus sp.]